MSLDNIAVLRSLRSTGVYDVREFAGEASIKARVASSQLPPWALVAYGIT
jgi:hypothetical protein